MTNDNLRRQFTASCLREASNDYMSLCAVEKRDNEVRGIMECLS
jgi:hypothetical protein